MAIFEQEGLAFLFRWGHFLAGITWIGLLYYFNFVQAASFAEMDAGARTNATQRLVPRALAWFRYGALATVVTGILVMVFQEQFDGDYIKSLPGMSIYTGFLLGLVMLGNVWGVIWRAQKKVIANANRVAAGGEPDPDAAAAARRGLLASRTNVIFSIPLLFFMGATSHFAVFSDFFEVFPEGSDRAVYWIVTLVLVAIIELNALGIIGGTGQNVTNRPLETVQNVVVSGFVLSAIWYVLIEALFGI